MEVTGPGAVQSSFPLKASQPAREVAQPSQTKPIETDDKVEISSVGKMLENLETNGEVRAQRLAEIKAAIDAGVYETPEKLEAALSKLLDEIGYGDDA